MRQKAIDDLNDIWEYTFEKWSENQADKYYETIKYACKEIGVTLDVGKRYSGISKDLLGLKTQKNILFYHRISEDKVEIIRILHEKMDLKNKLIE